METLIFHIFWSDDVLTAQSSRTTRVMLSGKAMLLERLETNFWFCISKRDRLYRWGGDKMTKNSNKTPRLTNIRLSLERFEKNPILKPDTKHLWETKAMFNPAALYEAWESAHPLSGYRRD